MGPRTRTRAAVAFLSGCVALLLGAGPAPAQGLLDANCPGPPNVQFTNPGDHRVAQTFTAQRTGAVVRGEVEVNKSGVPGGDWVVRIAATDGSGIPTNTVLASTTIADATVPGGNSRLAGVFAPPASVVGGQQYALLLTRPGALHWTVRGRVGNPCPGKRFISQSFGSGAWFDPDPDEVDGFDPVFAVYVKPTNAFTLGPISRNKKKGTATLTVNVPNPGELTGSGKGVQVAGAALISKTVTAPGKVKLTIKAKGKKKTTLNETGKVKLKPKITYTPTGGDPSTQSRKLKLKKKL
jgi:hypothetical protein